MVKSITFNKVALSIDFKANYVTELPCLKGKKFEFKRGLNIICGYNGCGKSSLLKCIRRMTFCDKQVHSKLQTDDWTWSKVSSVNRELYSSIDLMNDWNKSVFSLRPADEVTGENFCDDQSTFAQMMSSGTYSSGMNTTSAVAYLLTLIHNSRKGSEEEDIRDFNKQVMNVCIDFRTKSTLAGASEGSPTFCVKKYISEHHVDTNGITVIMDEPDRSLDILTMDKIFNLLNPDSDRPFTNSFLVVFHNSDMIHRLMTCKNSDVINWIELTPGYLENVEHFHKGETVNHPETTWWLKTK